MQRWEYKVFVESGDRAVAELNRLGREGWELVAVIETQVFYLKRPLD